VPHDLSRDLASALGGRPFVTRFAPAPTGHLHLGHLVSAIYVWGLARAVGGKVLLRIEDHDRGRSRPEFERAILEDLEWLGLLPDAPPPSDFSGPSDYRQSDCQRIYEAALALLAREHHVYGCRCTRKDIAEAAPAGEGEESSYPGTCRNAGIPPGPGIGTRLAWPSGLAPELFKDALLGEQSQEPADQCGDLLLRDRMGNWTYQFAAAVDDLRMAVTVVIRGTDLLPSTGRQIRLARLLGREDPPVFVHHPLIRRSDGRKLSKASRDTGLRDLRSAGRSAGELLGEAAFLAGLLEERRSLGVAELGMMFGER